MAVRISGEIAQRIVETVKDICGRDINFFRTDATIYASTDRKRIGDYHEIAAEVIRTGQTIETRNNEIYVGTRKGVNMPIFFHKELCGVIGISGEPDEVRKYAQLAQRIVHILLSEQEMESSNNTRRAEKNYMVQALIGEKEADPSYVSGFLHSHELDERETYRTVIIKECYTKQWQDLSGMEQDIAHVLESCERGIYTFLYPERYLLLLPEKSYSRQAEALRKLADRYPQELRIGVGQAGPLISQKGSYESAQIALKSIDRNHGRNYACYDDMDLEILLGSIPEKTRHSFYTKVAGLLEESEIELLRLYFENDRSLEITGKQLFIHKNTLQYKLNRIADKTGYNPRNYRESVVLFLAVNSVQ